MPRPLWATDQWVTAVEGSLAPPMDTVRSPLAHLDHIRPALARERG